MQNWAMHCSACPRAKARCRHWRVGRDRRVCIRRLSTPALCIFLAAFLLPVAEGKQFHSARDLEAKPLWNTQAQQPRAATNNEQKPPEYSISVESKLVVMDILVTDEDGNVLSGLKKGNFRILDNGKPQVITYFAPTEDPITIVMLMEYSGLAYNYFAYKARFGYSALISARSASCFWESKVCLRLGRFRSGSLSATDFAQCSPRRCRPSCTACRW